MPAGFLWGTATAAHQVEGGNENNDWWDWEQTTGHIKDGSRSGLACDHFRRYQDDFQLLADLGQNAHRLSIEWSRVEPHPGQFDAEALAHYRRVLETMRALGLEPVVTLHHFTNPRWLAQQGAWTRPEVVDAFGRFVERVVRAYRDLVRFWITVNEPNIYASLGFATGEWPPGARDMLLAFRVLRHMVLAHGRAYQVIHREQPEARVSLAHHLRVFDPDRPAHRLDIWTARARDALFNRSILVALRDGRLRPPLGWGERIPELVGSLDYVGVNYYSRDRLAFDPLSPHRLFAREVRRECPRNACGWEIYPEGLYRVVRQAAEFGPVLITENGTADQDDELRPAYLLSHVRQLGQAVQDGLPVLGYLHWSSMDNFEWAQGFRMRFGLVHVDFATQERRVKPSGELYARICRAGGLTPDLLALAEARSA
ncbi:MAG: glycoside hydrolase family 1 protein [Chloroflexi bacterium]|nr:glycoside hydrolase family 1 protein [Chloroflexota bacterium]